MKEGKEDMVLSSKIFNAMEKENDTHITSEMVTVSPIVST